MKQFFEQCRRGNLLSGVHAFRFPAYVLIQRRTVHIRNLSDIPAAFGAAFQLQRPYPKIHQVSHIPQQAQILWGPNAAERFTLADFPEGFA